MATTQSSGGPHVAKLSLALSPRDHTFWKKKWTDQFVGAIAKESGFQGNFKDNLSEESGG